MALLAEHSFWFSGFDMKAQLPHAIKSFKSQRNINITKVIVEIETAFNNTTERKNPAWLIQWVINNKLVCNIIFALC